MKINFKNRGKNENIFHVDDFFTQNTNHSVKQQKIILFFILTFLKIFLSYLSNYKEDIIHLPTKNKRI